MDTFQNVITIISTILGVIITATGMLIPLVKNIKAKKALQSLNQITTQIQPLVIEAEKFSQYTGVEKKQFVLTRLNDYAFKNGLKFDLYKVAELIDQIVATTKQVNKNNVKGKKEEIL